MRIRVNLRLCNGTGLCEGFCPELFEVGDDGFALPKFDVVPSEYEGACLEAAEHCPSEAIRIEE